MIPIHLFSAKLVAQELGRNQVTARQRWLYLTTSFVIFSLFYYSGLMVGNPVWSPLSLYEGVVVLVITILGFIKTYEASGGDRNPDFVVQFSCLYVPVSITTILVIWPSYWLLTTLFRDGLIALSESHVAIAVRLSHIGGDFFALLSFLAVVMVQGITFLRIYNLFGVVNENAG